MNWYRILHIADGEQFMIISINFIASLSYNFGIYDFKGDDKKSLDYVRCLTLADFFV